jgi:hypothetical protein
MRTAAERRLGLGGDIGVTPMSSRNNFATRVICNFAQRDNGRVHPQSRRSNVRTATRTGAVGRCPALENSQTRKNTALQLQRHQLHPHAEAARAFAQAPADTWKKPRTKNPAMTKSAPYKQRLVSIAKANRARQMQLDAVPVPAHCRRHFTPLDDDAAAERKFNVEQ